MPSTLASNRVVLLAAGRKPNVIYIGTQSGRFFSGWARALRFFHCVFSDDTGRLAPFRYKVDGIGRKPSGVSPVFLVLRPDGLRNIKTRKRVSP